MSKDTRTQGHKDTRSAAQEKILLGHGSGGKLTHRLLKDVVFPAFSNPLLDAADDAAVCSLSGKIAFTTDSFVVQPLFFPGGDIGKLAVCGTVNDLAVMGAVPRYLTAACIIEEGLPQSMLERIIASMAQASRAAGVAIVGGDLKVVERGACDKIFITTTGIGAIPAGITLSCARARPGDAVIINGSIGEHGCAVMAARKEYGLSTSVTSDCASLNGLIKAVLDSGAPIHAMRDPTRGGVATTLNEIANQSNVEIVVQEDALPVSEPVRGFCELLGIDPLYMANEGKVLVVAAQAQAPKILAAMKRHPLGRRSCIIGTVARSAKPVVLLRTAIGSTRILDMLTGEQLPRIC